ncbi:MAG: hypothetical protein ACREXI_12550 [Caldimonas sp.]
MIAFRLFRTLALGIVAASVCAAAAASPVPVGYLAWDVTDPGMTGEFDIVNQTGPNSSGDSTWPVTSSLTFSSLSLAVSFSNGTMSTFGEAYFTLSGDGLSFDGSAIALGNGAAVPTGAVLTGVLAPTDAALFDAQIDHFLPTFSARIPSRDDGLIDGDLALIDATTVAVSSVPEPDVAWLFATGLLPLLARAKAHRRRHSTANRRVRTRGRWSGRAALFAAALLAIAAPAFAAVKLNSWSAPSKGVAGKTLVNLTATGVLLQSNETPQSIAVSFADSCGGAAVASAPAASVVPIVATSIRVQVKLPATLTARTYAVSVSGTTTAGAFVSGNCSLVNVAAPVDDWQTLITSNWTMPAQTEGYVCRIIVAQSDMYISALRAASAPYLAILTIADTSTDPVIGADFSCGAGSSFGKGVFMAGPGTGELTMPGGVAMHVRPGQFLLLDQHVVNDTDQGQVGSTVIQVRTADPATITGEAEFAFAGTFLINDPSDGLPHTAVGSCFSSGNERVFALQPHLQSAGVHVSLTRTRNGQQATLIDADYSLVAQPISPVAAELQDLEPGDHLTTACTYVNTSGQTETFGESSHNEQCFVGMYRTPPHVPSNPTTSPIYACALGMN